MENNRDNNTERNREFTRTNENREYRYGKETDSREVRGIDDENGDEPGMGNQPGLASTGSYYGQRATNENLDNENYGAAPDKGPDDIQRDLKNQSRH
jgi:hypothetical protein